MRGCNFRSTRPKSFQPARLRFSPAASIMSAMIKLQTFGEADIPRLIGWIPDARILLQWAAPQYKYPLDDIQLLATLEKTRGERPSHFMFAASHQMEGKVVGHVELMAVDYEKSLAGLGRVLIGKSEDRGKGYGTTMVTEALNYGFDTLELAEIRLGVFDFNCSAISCYQKLSFVQSEFRQNARQFENEFWNLLIMKLDKQSWIRQRKTFDAKP